MAHFSDTMIKDKLYVFDSIYLTPARFKAISYNSDEASQSYYCNTTSTSTMSKVKDVKFRGKGLLYGDFSARQINLNGDKIYTHTNELNLRAAYAFNNFSTDYYGLHTYIHEYASSVKQSYLKKYIENVIDVKDSTVHGNSIETVVDGIKAEKYNNEINTTIKKKNTIVLTGDKSETIKHEYNSDGTLKYNGNSNITISGVSRYDVIGIYDKNDPTLYKSGGYLNINVLKNTTLNSEANSIEASVSNYIHAKVNEISSPAGNVLNSLASIRLGNALGTGGISITNDAYNETETDYTPLNTGIKINNTGRSSIDIDSVESNINITSRTKYISLASNFYNSETEDLDHGFPMFRNYGISLLNSGFQNSDTGIMVLNKGTKDVVVESDNSNIKLYSKAIVLENNHTTDDQQNPDEDMIYGTEIPSTGVNGQIFFKVVS